MLCIFSHSSLRTRQMFQYNRIPMLCQLRARNAFLKNRIKLTKKAKQKIKRIENSSVFVFAFSNGSDIRRLSAFSQSKCSSSFFAFTENSHSISDVYLYFMRSCTYTHTHIHRQTKRKWQRQLGCCVFHSFVSNSSIHSLYFHVPSSVMLSIFGWRVFTTRHFLYSYHYHFCLVFCYHFRLFSLIVFC